MVLLSAYDDFVLQTLAAVPGRLGKLAYLAGLRTDDGQYCHWGLAQVYGEPAARRAVAQAHTRAWIDVLQAPLQLLWQEMAAEDVSESSAQQLTKQRDKMIPSETGGGSVRHFNSVLSALVALCRAQRDANRKAA